MAMSHSGDRAPLVLRRQGAQSKFDIVAIASELQRAEAAEAALRILFDWSQVTSWPFEAPPAAAIEAWNKTAPSISRAAVVHSQKWYRQAAVLSALMRLRNAQVKSFQPSDTDKALAWLQQGPQFSSSGGRSLLRDQEGC
jgi:hypothetical protein